MILEVLAPALKNEISSTINSGRVVESLIQYAPTQVQKTHVVCCNLRSQSGNEVVSMLLEDFEVKEDDGRGMRLIELWVLSTVNCDVSD